ncbi:MAG TPA: helix-hairpin-helix domain-containing protein [Polyangiaceae bacterium]
MSIFSRLFNKNAEDDDGSDAAGEETGMKSSGEEEVASKLALPSEPKPSQPEGKGTMRPKAPSFQINPPAVDVDGGWPPAVSSVLPVDRAAKSAQQASAQAASAAARTQVFGTMPQPPASHRGTARVGHPGAPPAPYASPPAVAVAAAAQPTRSPLGGQRIGRPAAPLPPPPGAAREKAQAQPIAAPPPRAPFRPALDTEPHFAPPRSAVAAARAASAPTPDEVADGLLTLELGASATMEVAAPVPPFAEPPAALDVPPVAAPPPVAPPPVAQAPVATVDMAAIAVAAIPPKRRTPPPPATDLDSIGNFLNDLDEAFGAIVESANGHVKRLRPSEQPPPSHSIVELKDLFVALAVNHMRQVRDFMIGVRWGEPPRNWLPICEPAVNSLLRAAKEMELTDLCVWLENFRAALTHAADTTGTTIAGESREALLVAYANLTEQMPEVFALDEERSRREAIIVHALLQQVPEVHKVTIDKIYAAGLTSLDVLFLAKPDEIAATTGVSEQLAARIVEKVRHYRNDIASIADATRSSERERLAQLASELRELHEAYEQAATGWSEDAKGKKKQLRQARAEVVLQIKVLLAFLGEVDRLNQIEKLPFGRKIEELEAYLRQKKAERRPAS